MIFNGDLSITQKTGGKRCIFELSRQNYPLEGRFVLGDSQSDEGLLFVGIFNVLRPGTVRVETDQGDDESISQAYACPLATHSATFKQIRLAVPESNGFWRQDGKPTNASPDLLRVQLNLLCKGHSTANPEIPSTSIAAPTTPAPPMHEEKGKGKAVDTPIQPDPVTVPVPASEKLKAFAMEANERREALKAVHDAAIADLARKFAVEMSNLEQEHLEAMRMLEDEIAAREDLLRSEAQMGI